MLSRNSRLGLILFGVYLLLYGGFVMLNAFSPQTMAETPVAGVNLAVLYGFALIVAALVLALLYGFLCRNEEVPANANRASDLHAESDAAGEGDAT